MDISRNLGECSGNYETYTFESGERINRVNVVKFMLFLNSATYLFRFHIVFAFHDKFSHND